MKFRSFWGIACLTLFAQTAFAHTFGAHGASLYHGFIHPFSGLDHLLAMLAVGIWAAQIGGHARWRLPCAFLAMLALGGGMGMAGWPLPQVELGVAGSVVVFGLLIAGAARVPLSFSMAIVGAFALFHGHAHGTEMPQAAAPWLYALGLLSTTAALHGLGVLIGLAHRDQWPARWLRLGGVGMTAAGAWLLAGL